MAPFLRVKIVKCEPGASIAQNGSNFDPFVAVNVKECIMEEGNYFMIQLQLYCPLFCHLQ